MRSRRGFTIPEMLVVVTLFAIIGTVVAALFTRGNSVYRHGESHIEMQRYGRQVINRLTPYVSSMFDAKNPSYNPVISPPPDPTIDSEFLTFRTTEDWLAPVNTSDTRSYPDAATSSLQVTNASELENLNFVYQVRYDNPDAPVNGTGNIILTRLDPTTFDPVTYDPADPSTFTVTNDYVLVRRKTQEKIKNFRFNRVRSTLILLQFDTEKETRSDANQPITITENFRATFNLPSKSV